MMQECDHVFRTPGGRGTSATAVRQACALAARWVQAVSEETLPQSGLPNLPEPPPPAAQDKTHEGSSLQTPAMQSRPQSHAHEAPATMNGIGLDDATMHDGTLSAHEELYEDEAGMDDVGYD